MLITSKDVFVFYSCRLSPVVSKASAGTMEWLKIYGSEDLPMHLNVCNINSYQFSLPDTLSLFQDFLASVFDVNYALLKDRIEA